MLLLKPTYAGPLFELFVWFDVAEFVEGIYAGNPDEKVVVGLDDVLLTFVEG